MKYIKKFDVNEALKDQIRKLGTGSRDKTKGLFLGRAIDDIQAKKYFEEMKKDFEKYDKNCGKIMIIDDYKVVYVFGEFDIVKNSPMTGNFPDDKYQTEYKVSFFKEGGLEPNKGRFEIEKTIPNPKHDPELKIKWDQSPTDEEREKLAVIKRSEDSFKISYDVAKKIYDYFKQEFIKQYPQLKLASHMNQMDIQTIGKGEKPRLGSVDIFDPHGTEIIYPYTDVNDKEKLERYIKNNKCIKGRNYKREYITYFTIPSESEDLARDNVINMERDEVDKQNMERLHKQNN